MSLIVGFAVLLVFPHCYAVPGLHRRSGGGKRDQS